MKLKNLLRYIAIGISVICLCFSTFQTTLAYMVVATDPLVNIFTSNDEQSLTLKKVVEHPFASDYKIPDHISFSFQLDFGKEYARTEFDTSIGTLKTDKKGRMEVVLKPEESFQVNGLKKGQVVTIKEEDSIHPGFEVKGKAKQKMTIGDENTVVFTNLYTPQAVSGEKLYVDGYKVLEGLQWNEDIHFDYKLEYLDGDEWKEAAGKQVLHSSDDDSHVFDFYDYFHRFSFEEAGTYKFRIKEAIGELPLEYYDQTINCISVTVSDADMDGYLEISQISGNPNVAVQEVDGSFYATAVFNNTYLPVVEPENGPIETVVKLEKTIENKGTLKSGVEGFEFVLENTKTNEKIMRHSDKHGEAQWKLKYTKDDVNHTYQYRVYETDLGMKGMTYDTKQYLIDVEVRMDEDHQMYAIYKVDGVETNELNVSFHNIYNLNKVKNPDSGDRTNLLFWIAMVLVSGVVLISLLMLENNRISEKR